ncbi:MAG TPA: hypothetical protein VHR45_07065 [Thermoanaerobaculia bacterium]|nr:hypothetical protein [Thermoanaerobaculia bacterium]
MRLLHGELPAGRVRELRDRLGREPELAAVYERLERTWEGLTLPPAAPVPLGFGGRVMARVREGDLARSGGPAGLWSNAPNWVRATGAAALLAGALLGAGLGSGGMAEERHGPPGVPTLTESYWTMVDEGSAAPLPPQGTTTGGEAHR